MNGVNALREGRKAQRAPGHVVGEYCDLSAKTGPIGDAALFGKLGAFDSLVLLAGSVYGE